MQFFADLASFQFLQMALVAAVLSSIVAGVVGSIVVVRRSTYIAGAISHCVLGGLGAARYLQVVYGMEWCNPLIGALAAAICASGIITLTTVYARERTDSVLSIIWALGMAVGISFIVKTPGYSQDLMSYLFGSILIVSGGDLLLMVLFDAVILVLVYLFYNRLVAVCFHEEAARVRGIPVGLYTAILSVVIALSTVLLSRVVGIVLVIALLSIPAATVARFSNRLSTMMIYASGLSLVVSVVGLYLSYEPQLPAGATIVEILGICYILVIVFSGTRKTAPKSSIPAPAEETTVIKNHSG